MQVLDTFLDAMGNTPLVRLHTVTRGVRPTVLAKLRDAEPRRIGEGSDRDPDDRGRRAGGPAEARRHDRRADLAATPATGSRSPRRSRGYKCIFVMPDKMSQEKISPPARVRRRGRDHAPRPSRPSRPRPTTAWPIGSPRRSPARSSRTSTSTPRTRKTHYETTGPEIWATDRRTDRRVRRGRRHRRHDHAASAAT